MHNTQLNPVQNNIPRQLPPRENVCGLSENQLKTIRRVSSACFALFSANCAILYTMKAFNENENCIKNLTMAFLHVCFVTFHVKRF